MALEGRMTAYAVLQMLHEIWPMFLLPSLAACMLLTPEDRRTPCYREVALGPAEGFFAVLKPIEIDLAIGSEVVPALSFQAGAGWAF